jgi:hypothetical protein
MADLTVAAETCVALGATEHHFEWFPGRDIALGALTVTRVLPVKGKRLTSADCLSRTCLAPVHRTRAAARPAYS